MIKIEINNQEKLETTKKVTDQILQKYYDGEVKSKIQGNCIYYDIDVDGQDDEIIPKALFFSLGENDNLYHRHFFVDGFIDWVEYK